MASEVGYLAVGHVESQVWARVSALADLEGVTSRLDHRFKRVVQFDRPDTLAVDHDVERATPKLT
jgi:hypothetical protein